MKKYEFKLQKLLDIREDQEDKSKMEFQKAKEDSMKVKEKLDSMKYSYDKYKDLSRVKNPIQQKITHIYLKSLTESIDAAEREFQNKQKIVEVKREEMKKRQIDRKTVDILKEKDKTAFMRFENRIEQNQNDEFALYGFIRKNLLLKEGE
ncbi:flagellar export protein FliJ [Clostridium tyrobutyricum]|uniref:Flagellar FliJ protein n=1 Tax=Clostridium tyrobutyricum DIVETGP TaxID=1408889 RepID=W6N694_CLOTY|nr:flagellar export protein FliJ [Clostridium tyrobutyricum]AND85280.1 flagellar biosynthesis chaperone FliJ [Clostridium tyrobutyricum]ANP69836.1 flagellar export protein FliJ [Clostridium tyrobutyricum]MBV4434339.1 flagellar export protein FliJ [Clostridium tyrobutyricum]QCH26875.1 flagellar biosynthesis chaperone [Clostridium tyrobutyricum]QNB65798.1 flagellar export protein FliJ [Clostridium tyrobutyricum]